MMAKNSDDEKMLEAAIEKYADMVKRISFLYVKNHSDTEDIMQRVFIKYMLHGEKIKNENHEKSWFTMVTVNESKDYLKSYWKKNVSGFGTRDFPVPEEKEDGIIEHIKRLPEKYKLFIYLFYYEEYSVPEISKLTGINTNTIYSGLYRARMLLKEYLKDEENKPD